MGHGSPVLVSVSFFLYSMLYFFISWIKKVPNNINLFFFLFIWNVIKKNFFWSILNFLNMSQREMYTDNLSNFDLREFQFTKTSWWGMECTRIIIFFFFSFSQPSLIALSLFPLFSLYLLPFSLYHSFSYIYLEFFLSYQCFTIHRIQGRQVQCRYSRVMLNYLISWQDYYTMHVRVFREESRIVVKQKPCR